jgi:RNA polymerase sigma factor (sigma-70 family)
MPLTTSARLHARLSATRCQAGGRHSDATVFRAARAGDPAAWRELVERHDGALRRVASGFRLPAADVEDVVQQTWLVAYAKCGMVRDPEAVGAWLRTLARRHALRSLQQRTRELPVPECSANGEPAAMDDAVDALHLEQRRVGVRTALTALPERHRRILLALMVDPALEYRRISEMLDVPVGSIGPIRARCLNRLSQDPRLRRFAGA